MDSLHRIRTFGDPALGVETKEVTRFDASLRQLSQVMISVMHRADGVGLAANQIGVARRVFVYQLLDDGAAPGVCVNPRLLDRSIELREQDEGCLSVPGLYYPTARHDRVSLAAVDLNGEAFEVAAEGLLARIFQHECDHLDGRLFLSRLTKPRRRGALRQIRAGALDTA